MYKKIAALALGALTPFAPVTSVLAAEQADGTVGYNLATGQIESTLPAPSKSIKTIVVSEPLVVKPSPTWPATPPIKAQASPTLTQPTTQAWYSSIFSNPNASVGDGLAVGAQVGYSSAQAQFQITNGDEQDRGITGGLGGLHISYGYTFQNQFYLGAQVYGNLQNSSSTFTSQVAPYENTTRKIGNNAGATLLPGFHLDPSNLLYLKLGYNAAQLEIDTVTKNQTQTQSGFDAGAGFRQGLSANVSLALEYDWIHYPNKIESNAYGSHGYMQFNQQIYQLSLDYQLNEINSNPAGWKRALHLTGPYAGLSAGSKSLALNTSSTDVNTSLITQSLFVGNGWAEKLKIGYGYQINNWAYLGAELSGELDQNVGPHELGVLVVTENYGVALSLLPGYIITDANMLFARFGLADSNFTGNNIQAGAASNFNKNVTGFIIGLGYETALTDVLSLALEYDYTKYSEFNGELTRYSISNQYKINDSYMSLGLNYRF